MFDFLWVQKSNIIRVNPIPYTSIWPLILLKIRKPLHLCMCLCERQFRIAISTTIHIPKSARRFLALYFLSRWLFDGLLQCLLLDDNIFTHAYVFLKILIMLIMISMLPITLVVIIELINEGLNFHGFGIYYVSVFVVTLILS
jgi:hypothetical protein